MISEFDAIYENGMLRPLVPLQLAEQERVKLTVKRDADESWLDVEYMDSCAAEADETITLESVRESLSKIKGSMDTAIDETRGEY
jgi:predicted DNA-binding antitoxin AbrB/MazE fold protein